MFDHSLLYVNLTISCLLIGIISVLTALFFLLWGLVFYRLLLTLFLNMWRMLVFIQEMPR